jgi:hypothetical protein
VACAVTIHAGSSGEQGTWRANDRDSPRAN